MAGVHIVVKNADVLAALRSARAATSNMRPLFLEIGEELQNSTEGRFATETDPNGQTWAPLSRAYLQSEQKKRSRGPNRILTLTGAMGSTISYQASARSVVVGSNRIYAATQQFGRRTQRGTIPARPFLGLSSQDRATIVDTALGYLQDSIGG